MRVVGRASPVGALLVIGLLVAGCSSSGSSTNASTPAGSSSSSTSSAGSAGSTGSTGSGCSGSPDTSIDATLGHLAGDMQWRMACAKTKPLKATGTPITIGAIDAVGDPTFSFPQWYGGFEASVAYVNDELGGVGADPATGKPGRPIKVTECPVTPDTASVASCTSKLVADHMDIVISGNNTYTAPIWSALPPAKIVAIGDFPSAPVDFNTPNVYSIAPSGGGVGLVEGMTAWSLKTIKAKKIMVGYDDNPGGIALYDSFVAKPVKDAPAAKTLGTQVAKVPIPPGTTSWSSIAAKVLAYKPDVLMLLAAPAEQWSLTGAMAQQGWTPDQIHVIGPQTSAQPNLISAAGANGIGISFSGPNLINQPDLFSGLTQTEAQTYVDKMKQYSPKSVSDGYSATSFEAGMTLFQTLTAYLGSSHGQYTYDGYNSYLKSTKDVHMFGDAPWGCATAPAGYRSICAPSVAILQSVSGGSLKIGTPSFNPFVALATG
jgi:ABC-type branched-subunit amino acid transport system substrate-binding protein